MIKLQDAELISVLPPYLKNDTDIQAISYAYQMGMAKMLEYTRKTMLYANLDELPDEILDLLALEFRTQYYDQDMDIDTKRKLIRNTLAWYEKGGTVSAVEEMVKVLFGSGDVVDWYEEGGTGIPGTFVILTDEELSETNVSDLAKTIDKVKTVRAGLSAVGVTRKIEESLYLAAHSRAVPHVAIYDGGIS